jgi:hypothetical protein
MSSKIFCFMFGGINAMYCASDTWLLELSWRTRAQAGSTYMASVMEDLHIADYGREALEPVDAALRQAKIECRIAQRELLRETKRRMIIQKKCVDAGRATPALPASAQWV